MAKRKFVAFVSEKNACRSIIAQAYAMKFGFDYFDFQSFGLKADQIHYLVTEVLREKDFDTTFYFSKSMEVINNQKFDILITMHPSVQKQLPELSYTYELVKWDFEDPIPQAGSEEEVKKGIEALCTDIEKKVKEFIEIYKEVTV